MKLENNFKIQVFIAHVSNEQLQWTMNFYECATDDCISQGVLKLRHTLCDENSNLEEVYLLAEKDCCIISFGIYLLFIRDGMTWIVEKSFFAYENLDFRHGMLQTNKDIFPTWHMHSAQYLI